jgi:predicted DNA binding CopG/RHH family protein
LTTAQLDKIYQRERDLMDMAFRGSESEKDRNVNILLADKNLEAYRDKIEAEGDMAFGAFVADTVKDIFF